ncbi:hypothetical protein K1T71_014491 [Dendrolimus kikuchii]|uniref:Uncharacterized protein n=1 Tax=Dendrolimus kikuchii TaxID=765133 RepID=A0ACC1CEG6_9NEOP|nr:hypothetical protein K1T71_014491 [Dendrolimus kikuchii]
MFLKLFLLNYFIALTSVNSAVLEETISSCSNNEFECRDGACISSDRVCDNVPDCASGDDEETCSTGSVNFVLAEPIIHRYKRQASRCRRDQWQCRDGTCISFDGKCDGVADCPDGSDETHALCRKVPCQSNWFRCTYGACVDGTAPCNGIQECVDNSDELLPRCRNETMEVNGNFKCDNGDVIIAANLCDGARDCADGSDETIKSCASKKCLPYLFQCAYGACVDQGSDCNNIKECADGSDEADDLCNRNSGPVIPVTSSPNGKCVLPKYPDHGSYVTNIPNAKPGQKYDSFQINVTCNKGYGVVGDSSVICLDGWSMTKTPECIPFCKLPKQPSVDYYCLLTGNVEGRRVCNEYEPSNTQVIPECKKPNYYSPNYLRQMTCIDGSWSYMAICEAECGRVTPVATQLVIGGKLAKRGELPWHAGIYTKTTRPYMQICGGSLVSTTVVISAAHCFWLEEDGQAGALTADLFAVALGKIYRPWNDPVDSGAQKFDVKELKLPTKFRGNQANFQEDIALVTLSAEVELQTYIRPVCLSFEPYFNQRQLKDGNLGKVAGWGLTSEDGGASPILKVVELPYVDTVQCQEQIPGNFIEYITSDKICAGYNNGTALCKGDSGGGLVFPALEHTGVTRYYLRGIVSTAPKDQVACNAFTLTTFTEIMKHEFFIRQGTSV